MSDITERLRAIDTASRRDDGTPIPLGEYCTEAADEIERLRAALREAIEWDSHDSEGVPAVWLAAARAALGDQP